MKHQITTKMTNDEWEQVMTCEFANATIAELVLVEVAHKENGKTYLSAPNKLVARLERDGAAIIVTSYLRHSGWLLHWDTDPDANKDALEALAKDWQEQERVWLPIMRYFEVGAKKYNASFNKWANQRDEELAELEHQIKNEQLKRKGDVKFLEGQITKLLENLLTIEGQIHDLLDCLEMDGNQIKNLRKAFFLHKERLFHFLDRREE